MYLIVYHKIQLKINSSLLPQAGFPPPHFPSVYFPSSKYDKEDEEEGVIFRVTCYHYIDRY